MPGAVRNKRKEVNDNGNELNINNQNWKKWTINQTPKRIRVGHYGLTKYRSSMPESTQDYTDGVKTGGLKSRKRNVVNGNVQKIYKKAYIKTMNND